MSNTLLFLLLENLRPTGRCGLVPLSEITLGELSLKSFEPNLIKLLSKHFKLPQTCDKHLERTTRRGVTHDVEGRQSGAEAAQGRAGA